MGGNVGTSVLGGKVGGSVSGGGKVGTSVLGGKVGDSVSGGEVEGGVGKIVAGGVLQLK